MKISLINSAAIMLLLWGTLSSCDENQILPGYQKLGTATQTAASIAVSNDEPVSGEAIVVTMKYVHPSADPLTQVQLKAKVDDADYIVVETYTLQSSQLDSEVSQTVNYIAPASGTTVVFDMVLTSGKEYPQVKRATIEVQ